MPPEERRRNMLKAVVASTVGTSIEWYDYFLFGTMAGLVFPHLFFPKSDALAGTLNSYAIFFVGFLARPIGGVLFGHRVGERVVELLRGEGDGAVVVERALEHRERRPQLRRGQREDTLRSRRVDRDSGER